MTTEPVQPPIEILLGPAWSGKTAECLRRLADGDDRARLVAPTQGHAEQLKRRAAALGYGDAAPRIRTFGEELAHLAGVPQEAAVRRPYQRLVLADLFTHEVGPTDYFGRMHGAPGFPAALADVLSELKLSCVAPADVEAAAQPAASCADDPELARKAMEVARLYRRYEAFLAAAGQHDADDLPALAIQRLGTPDGRGRAPSLLLVDGFYRLSIAWRRVLSALAQCGAHIVVTLPHDASRPLLFATPSRILDAFRREFAVTETAMPGAASAGRPEPLAALERGLFAGEAGTVPAAAPAPRADALVIHDAPNPYTEVEMVARALRRAHDERGVPWQACAVVLRSVGEYAQVLEGVFERYGIPLALEQPRPVAENPLVATIRRLFDVYLGDWQREDVVAFAKSTYTGLGSLYADGLRRQARRKGVRAGRAAWQAFVEPQAGEKGVAGLLRRMLDWDTELRGEQTAEAFADKVGAIVASFDLSRSAWPADRRALQQALKALADLTEAARQCGHGPMSLDEYVAQATAVWAGATYNPTVPDEAVAIIEPYDARRIDARVVAVLGLVERGFPRRVSEDPFFRDDEREALREAAALFLDPQRERMDDERLLFYLAVTAPTEQLILSAPRSDDDADTLASFYLDEVRALFDHVPTVVRTLADVAPLPDECVNERDRLLAACAEATGAVSPPTDQAVLDVLATAGRPRVPELAHAALRHAYAAPRRYSVTELETYNRCPLQHLFRYGLKLRDEGDGAGAADKGTLLHSVLRRHFRRQAETDQPLDASAMRTALCEELDGCIGAADVDARPHRRQMMRRALQEALSGFADREVRYREVFGLTPTYFELAFGQEEEEADDEEVADEAKRDYDPASVPEPLVIPGTAGAPEAQLCGAIDRVDLAPDRRRALLMDYKLGASVPFPQMKEGKSLQMPLYAMALEELWGVTAAVGCYDSPRDRGRRRFFRTEHAEMRRFGMVPGLESGGEMVKPVSPDEFAETLRAAQDSARTAVAGIQACRVLPTPGDHCQFCSYTDVCRTSRDGVHDGEPLPEPPSPTPPAP